MILTYIPGVMSFVTDPFALEFMRLALVEVLLLAVAAGLLGAQVVLRRLAFFTHGVGTATFPGLVVAGPLGLPAQLTALGAALIFAGGLERLSRSARMAYDSATALMLVAALGLGIVLASDVFESGAGVDQLLFGTLIGLSADDVAVTAIAVGLGVGAWGVFGRAWLAAGFDPATAPSLGLRVVLADWMLILVVAASVVAALDAVGALLVSAILVLPAATVRLGATSVRALEAGAFTLAALEGVFGLWLAYRLDVPPGPAIAVLGGAVFAVVALTRALTRRAPTDRGREVAVP